MGFKALADKVQRVDMVVRGVPIVLRPLSAAESDRISTLLPRKEPPLVKDPDKGSAAPLVPDRTDAEFIASERLFFRRAQLAELAVAAGELEVIRDGNPVGTVEDLLAAVQALELLLTAHEVTVCSRKLAEASGYVSVEAAAKN